MLNMMILSGASSSSESCLKLVSILAQTAAVRYHTIIALPPNILCRLPAA
jgi:hypothetical protein